jgi:hypothetical protein
MQPMRIHSKIKRTGLAVLIGWASMVLPLAAGAESPSLQAAIQSTRDQRLSETMINDLLTASLEKGLTNDQTAELFSFVFNVQKAGLPAETFVVKIREGLAKRVNFSTLTASLRHRLDQYTVIQRMLRENDASSASHADAFLDTFVESLDMGLPLEALAALVNRSPNAPPEMLALAARNKALLNQLGFDTQLTDRMLNTGLEYRSFLPDWANLFKAAAAARRKGIPDRQFAEVVQKVLKEKGPLRRVLTDLAFTSRDLSSGPNLSRPVAHPDKGE